ncbi:MULTISPECIES: SRPBCC domain-containing protein [Arthrobacter]|uniref:GntR family transcriptional regulator n=1 Tax=Arthrobacter terricola TaxID=2547396 RepID=A0A4V6PIC7_9MICC|nr:MULTISPECIES: SRPBCC domain-containing protein [Arthrobacter]MBT8162825.1 SRPBCC domain-containing protein [Arthrobacter sp. GN70]TDF91944.1 GntR family transcriptional regulator [Arthrobacter terricola]
MAEFTYVTYIEGTPDRIWTALTDAAQSAEYWGHANVSDWKSGSRWEHQRTDGSETADVVGTILEATPPTRLVNTWEDPANPGLGKPDVVTFTIEAHDGVARLTVHHRNIADDEQLAIASHGWAAVISNLKSYIELGRPLPHAPWEMP